MAKIVSKGNCMVCGEPGYLCLCPGCKLKKELYDQNSTTIEMIRVQLKENYEAFIFSTIIPYVEEQMQMKIPKKLLIFALEEFKTNHPNMWNDLCKTEDENEKDNM